MKKSIVNTARFISSIAAGFLLLSQTVSAEIPLKTFAEGEHRSEKNKARNEYRNPVETLEFFGITPYMTLVEISPGGGWYTEILAPYLKVKGHYIAAGFDPESKVKYFSTNAKKFADKLKGNSRIYGKVELTVMDVPNKLDFAKENSADMVVSFRNTHNWMRSKNADKVFAAIYKVVKPNGIFGLVQHRADENSTGDTSGKAGYIKQSEVIKMVEEAGFRLVATSEINANPKDTKDYKEGVWALPPTYGSKDKSNNEKYKAIGESDRMTLKFVKPAEK